MSLVEWAFHRSLQNQPAVFIMVLMGIPCILAFDEEADRVLCGLNVMSIPALPMTTLTHRDTVLFEAAPKGLIVLISNLVVDLNSLVRLMYSESTLTKQSFLFLSYFLKHKVSKCFPGLVCFST